jgi:hypothetical protein
MKPYVIRQGDFLLKLAVRFGFDAEEVWNDPKNDDLRQVRKNPNILHPGDILYIPAKPAPSGLDVLAGTVNGYTAVVPRTEVKLMLRAGKKRFLSQPCTVEGMKTEKPLKTDGEGNLTLSVPVSVKELVVCVVDREAAKAPKAAHVDPTVRFRILLGHMDPVEERSGLRARLTHLGYYVPMQEDEEAELREAVLAFQCAAGLPLTGEPDEVLHAALVKAHGS